MSSSGCGVRFEVARAALKHMIAQVQATPFDEDPFPHLAIRNFFPADVYRQMLKLLPTDDQYILCNQEKNRGYDGNVNRSRFQLTNEHIGLLAPDSQALWYGVRAALGAPELRRAVFKQLAKGLAFRYGISEAEAPDVEAYAKPELFREVRGFRIAPHPDTRSKVVTMQISLAADESQAHLGTGFYRMTLKPSAWMREPRGFEVVKRMSFAPNAAYAFVVLNTLTKRSWHGRETLADDSGVRNSILHIYYGDRSDANHDLLREQEEAARGGERKAA